MKKVKLLIISFLAAVIFGIVTLCIIKHIHDKSAEDAAVHANAAGKVIGSYDGITKGLADGAKAGKEDGLSAKDTEAVIFESLKETGRLEVLKASVSISNFHEIGSDYAKLQVFYADVIFTADLEKAVIEDDGEKIRIILPAVECSIAENEEKTETLAEYQRYSFSGSAEDGYTAAHNTRKELFEKGTEAIENYSALKQAAENSALKNVRLLAESVNASDKEVEVVFEKGDE